LLTGLFACVPLWCPHRPTLARPDIGRRALEPADKAIVEALAKRLRAYYPCKGSACP